MSDDETDVTEETVPTNPKDFEPTSVRIPLYKKVLIRRLCGWAQAHDGQTRSVHGWILDAIDEKIAREKADAQRRSQASELSGDEIPPAETEQP